MLLAVALLAQSALAAQVTLETVSAESARKVEFSLCPPRGGGEPKTETRPTCPRAKGSPPTLAGETTLLVRLDPVDPMLDARFVPDTGRARKLLCGKTERIFLDGRAPESDCTFAPRPISGPNARSLRIGFRLPVGVTPTAIAGSLILGLDGKDEAKPIALEGVVDEFKDVAVNPTTLVLDSDDPEAEVTLVGSEVVRLLRSLALGAPTAILRDSAGDAVTAKIELPSPKEVAESGNPNLAKGKITITGDPLPGKYTGKLPLGHGIAGGPSLEIELHSHHSLCLMVLIVLAGIVGIGLTTRVITMSTRRSILLEALDQSLEAYECVVEPGKTKSWALSDLLGREEPDADETSTEEGSQTEIPVGDEGKHVVGFAPSHYEGIRLQGMPALRKSIEGARSSKDLDEDATRTLDMVARIQRWLRVEPVARLLANVASEDGPSNDTLRASFEVKGDGNDKKTEERALSWKDSQTYLGTLALLKMAKREPADSAKADDLVARLLDQARWHHTLIVAWDRAAHVPELAHDLICLDEAIKEEKTTAGARSQEQRDAIGARLRALTQPGLKPGQLPFPERPERCPERLGLTPVHWGASPNNFTGWATLDGQSYGQLASRMATSSKTIYRRRGFGRALLLEAKTFRPGTDLAWTGVLLVLTAATYGVANYSDTWGDPEDLVKAFLAGITGTAVVKWGAMPIYRSGRIRGVKSS